MDGFTDPFTHLFASNPTIVAIANFGSIIALLIVLLAVLRAVARFASNAYKTSFKSALQRARERIDREAQACSDDLTFFVSRLAFHTSLAIFFTFAVINSVLIDATSPKSLSTFEGVSLWMARVSTPLYFLSQLYLLFHICALADKVSRIRRGEHRKARGRMRNQRSETGGPNES